MTQPSNTLVILPTFNEAENIDSLCDSLMSLPEPVDLLFIDDASPDGTAERIRSRPEYNQRIFLLSRSGKLGLGSAYSKGFAWVLDRGYPVCVQMDADLSHNPKDIPRLLAGLREGADLAIGSRYIQKGSIRHWSLFRRFLSRAAGWYTRFWTQMPIADPTSGFKAIRREALESITSPPLLSEGYCFQIELHFRMWRAGKRLVEIPIVFTERTSGQSKLSTGVTWEAIRKVPCLRWTPPAGAEGTGLNSVPGKSVRASIVNESTH